MAENRAATIVQVALVLSGTTSLRLLQVRMAGGF
jgi:hypothetical protein